MVAEPQFREATKSETAKMDGYDGYPQTEDQLNECLATGDDEAYRTMKMTIKVPPAFNGHIHTQGYFAYEESVEEWVSITTIEQKLRGPHLRNPVSYTHLRAHETDS